MGCTSCEAAKNRPTLFAMVKEAARSAPRVVRQVVNGMFVDMETKNERMAVCQGCKEHYYPQTKQCLKCTCYVDKKTALACEECPLQKWVKVGNCEGI